MASLVLARTSMPPDQELLARCQTSGLGRAPADFAAALAWAHERLPAASQVQRELIHAWLELQVKTADATLLHDHLSQLETLELPAVWTRLVELSLREDPSGRRAYNYTEEALRKGVRDPEMLEAAVRARLQTGRRWEAARLLRAQPSCARRELLWHVTTKDRPLPETACACACASYLEPGTDAPDSTWLKCFFFINSDIHEYAYSLCLGCHQAWEEYFEFGSDPASWSRTPATTFASPSFWASWRSSAYPGRHVVEDPARFLRWVRGLRAAVSIYEGI